MMAEEEPNLERKKIIERISLPGVPEFMRETLRKAFRRFRPIVGAESFSEKIDNLVDSEFPGTTLGQLGEILATLAPEVYLDRPTSARPTKTPPGPNLEPTGRLAVYRARAERGRSLHHPEDVSIG
jgi:hypothetical protein